MMNSYVCGYCNKVQSIRDLSELRAVYNMQACHKCCSIDGLADTAKALDMIERDTTGRYADFGRMYVTKAQFDCLTAKHWNPDQFEILR